MTTVEITEYLKQVSILESAIYKQEKMIKAAKDNLVKRHIDLPRFHKPQIKEIKRPEKEEEDGVISLLAYIFGGIFILVSLIVGAFDNIVNTICFLIGLGIIALGFVGSLRDKKRINEKYERELRIYQQEKDASNKAYQQQFAQNKLAYERSMEAYIASDELASKNLLKAQAEVQLLDEPLAEAKCLLAQLYEKDVIFVKYRNMIAICTMYEYFASGRCTELTGANGAYNMYEQELRQNRIIDQLEQVNNNLEQIKNNQYILYQAISETNHALQEIATDVKAIVNAVTDIAVSSRITAYCSQLTAVNTRAQTYIALLK